MKTNVTLRVDRKLAKEAKVLAARRGTSLSRLLAEQLEELIRRDRRYEAAMQRALARLEEGFELEQQFSVSFWDALVLQSARTAGVSTLSTEDLSHGQDYRGMEVVNPFL